MTTTTPYDVAIVGGGPAGLSAAVTLARSLRSVVVLDAGEPRNAPAEGAHNLLGREGVAPRDLLATGRQEAAAYGAEVRAARVVGARRDGDGFVLDVASGTPVRARRVVLATGLVDELPDVPGVRDLWGTDVLHCPYCHGYEVRGRRIGVLATGPAALHQVLLMRQLSDDVTLFLHTAPEPDDAAWEQLAALGVRVVEGRVARLDVADGRLRGVVLDDGTTIAVGALAVAPRFVARGELFEQLGGTVEDHPMGGRFVPADPRGATSVPGVWAAGNTSDLTAMVGASAAAGVMAGGGVNADLAAEDAARAVERRRSPFSARAEAELAAAVAGDRAHGLG
ncbi:NAD(P)/FAD-dependent oxidoreductase [Cellulosimicrobium marinum]|uniref:NAD(P)/FAD-dependent oxidoreductase n=1 Tax=Cellulosimicrobium marinum TaxID=1638992 RepID=UPI001E501B96|nr:NAD(P)/FAD-dependent oxidoreductase [Cellulosimicrobium marinum]MCB7135015.1 NAD(P)/FAD-dependent oxidoreductase [Cellulosimicrobium marinum]